MSLKVCSSRFKKHFCLLFLCRCRVDGPGATSGGADDDGKETSDRADSSSVTVHNGTGSAAQMNQEVAIASSPSDDKAAVWSTPELVDAILEENFALRQQVQTHKDNIAKLQKVPRDWLSSYFSIEKKV